MIITNMENETRKSRYVRVRSTGDIGLVLHEYVQPASQWTGPADVPMTVVDNPAWQRPRHLRPDEYTEAPDYTASPDLFSRGTKKVTLRDALPASVTGQHRNDALYWKDLAEQAQLRIADLERQVMLLKAQLPADDGIG